MIANTPTSDNLATTVANTPTNNVSVASIGTSPTSASPTSTSPTSATPTDTPTSQKRRRGRPAEHRLSEMLAAINILSDAGVLVTPNSLGSLIGISSERAKEMLNLLANDWTDSLDTLIPLCDTANPDEYMRINSLNAAKIKPLRLTESQAQDCLDTFNMLGISKDNPLRTHIEEAFFPNNGFIPNESTVSNRTLSQELSHTLEVCAQAIAQAQRTGDEFTNAEIPEVTFLYRGTNDLIRPRTRHVAPIHIHMKDSMWFVESYDLESRGARSFIADKIENIELTSRVHTVPLKLLETDNTKHVLLTCEKDVVARVLAWNGAQIVVDKPKTIISIPYYRDRFSEWLPRQILALGNSVSYDDKHLKKEVALIAEENLARAKQLSVYHSMS